MPAKYHIREIKAAAFVRKPGYIDLILSKGDIKGEYVTLSDLVLKEIDEKFPPINSQRRLRGMTYPIAQIMEASARRPEGYVDFLFSRGKVEGDFITLDEATIKESNGKFPLKPKPPEPTVAEMAANFTTAMAGWAKAGFKIVVREVYEGRHAICLGCDYWDAYARAGLGKCRKCGCSRSKLWLVNSKCPLNPPKWH